MAGGPSPSVRPARDDAFWEALAARPWRRVRWRRPSTGGILADGPPAEGPPAEGPPADACCVAYGLPIHRAGTYYVRPAYTDGQSWLSQQGYDEMVRRTAGRRATRRTGRRPA